MKEIVGETNKHDLVHHQREGTGGEFGQIPKTLQLTMTFLNLHADEIFVTTSCGSLDSVQGIGVQEHPDLRMTIGVDLPVDNDIHRDGTLSKAPKSFDAGHLCLENRFFGRQRRSLAFHCLNGLPSFEFPFSDSGGRLREPGGNQWLSLKGLVRPKRSLSDQSHGIVIKIHVFLQWNQNVDSVFEFAMGDLLTVQKPPVDEEPFDNPHPDILNKLIDHPVEDGAFV